MALITNCCGVDWCRILQLRAPTEPGIMNFRAFYMAKYGKVP